MAIALCFVGCFGQNTTTLKLAASISCQNYDTSHNITRIKNFEIHTGRLFFSKKKTEEGKYGLNREVIIISNFKVEYTIDHEEKQYKFITLKPITVNYVTLCQFDKKVDELNLCSDVAISESMLVKVKSIGCSSNTVYHVIFKRKVNGLIAGIEKYMVTRGKLDNNEKETVAKVPYWISNALKVTPKQIDELAIAFSETSLLPAHGCTDNITYHITTRKAKYA